MYSERFKEETMSEKHVLTACFVCLSLFVCFNVSYGQGPSQGDGQKVVLTLEECIKKAVQFSPEIGESRYEEEVYRSKKLQADSAVYPQIEIIATTGVSPEAKEDEFLKTDVVDKSFNGVFGRIDYSLIQPIYTFGKIEGYKKAASSGVRAAHAGVEKKTSDIVLRTKELYYSLLLAKDLRNLVLEIRDDLVNSISKAEKQIEQGSPWADETNLFKLKAFMGGVENNLNEAEKGISLARDALMTSMGLPKGMEFSTADSSLIPEEKEPDTLNTFEQMAVTLRPEFTQLHEGLKARDALINVEKSNYYPHVFLAVKGYVSGATNRDRIRNPYVYDIFSDATGAAFLGLKWSIDFGITEGRVKEAKAEYSKLIEKKRFADEAIPLQVRKAYLDFEEARKNIVETEKGYKNAKKWLVTAIANFDLGIGEAKEIGEAAVLYAKLKADNLRSLYNQRLAYANLLYAAGTALKEIQW
jgi:outer membrane protein